jgi:hypothetical protein
MAVRGIDLGGTILHVFGLTRLLSGCLDTLTATDSISDCLARQTASSI